MELRARATPEQLSTLLEFMETHGDLARPLDGAQGRVRSDRLWSELTHILNSVRAGVSKTTDKWKKVWADWKSKTKKKGLAIRHHTRRTGDGPASRLTLSTIEERVLAIMALRVEGQTSVKELGFIKSQFPGQGDPLTEDHTLDWEIVYEVSHLSSAPSSQPSTSQPSRSWHLPSTAAPPSPPSPPSPTPSAAAAPTPPAPAAPTPPTPEAPTPPAPTPPTPAAPTTSRRRRPPAPPQSARRGLWPRSPKTPQSTGSPGRPRFRARRRSQAPNAFERAAREFTAVESRRLEIEETRLRHQHERELRALEIEHERNEVYRSLINVARDWLDYHRSRDNKQPVKCEH